MDTKTNSLNWFEIPATDLLRAKSFYENIFKVKLEDLPEMMNMKMSTFPGEMSNGTVNGALVQSQMHTPSQDGAIVYLNANPSIQEVIDRIPTAGGTVVVPRTQITPEIGYMAFFIDSEGNKVALHASE